MLEASGQVLRKSLSGLAERQRLIAGNLANIDTPGYRSRDIPFEQVLYQEMQESKGLPLVATAPGHLAASAAFGRPLAAVERQSVFQRDGNGVDVDAEMARLSETVIEYNTLAQLLTARLSILRAAVTEGRR